MIIDAHYHLEQRMEPVEALLDRMSRQGVERTALIPRMVEPIQVGRVAERASALLRSGLTGRWPGLARRFYNRTVTTDGKFSLLGKTYGICAAPRNESVARVMEAHPGRFFGWVFVNPGAGDALAELAKWARQPGWIGVKTHPFWHRYPIALLDDVAAYASEEGLPLLMHLGGDRERGDYRHLPERHPQLKIVYAHAGMPFYGELWDYAKGKDRVFVDLSGAAFVDDRLRRGAIEALGAEKCLYGTDGPYGHVNDSRALQQILQMPLSDADKERILGGNFLQMVNA